MSESTDCTLPAVVCRNEKNVPGLLLHLNGAVAVLDSHDNVCCGIAFIEHS